MSIEEQIETVSEPLLRKALAEADLNALRLALYHQTQDPELADMKVATFAVRGGAFEAKVLAKEHHQKLIEKTALLTNAQVFIMQRIEHSVVHIDDGV